MHIQPVVSTAASQQEGAGRVLTQGAGAGGGRMLWFPPTPQNMQVATTGVGSVCLSVFL